MQMKHLAVAVAAALAAGAASADTAVAISGKIKTGFEQYKLDNVAGGFGNENRVTDQSSRLIFKVNEDLGGGLRAFTQIDMRLTTDLGALGASGNTHVGLGGNWGKVYLGRQDLHYGSGPLEKATSLSDSRQAEVGNGPFSQMNGATIALGSRTPNVIVYDSPNFSGVSGRIAYSTNWAGNEGSGVADQSKDGAWNLALDYAVGPLKAGYSYWNAKAEGTTDVGDQRGDKLYGSYSFGSVTVGLGWDRSQLRLGAAAPMTKRTAMMLPLTWTGGAHTAAIVYARMGNQSGGAAGQINNDTSANLWRLSYQYALSKRTAVGVHYTRLDNKTNAAYNLFGVGGATGATAATAGQDVRQLYFGIGHSF